MRLTGLTLSAFILGCMAPVFAHADVLYAVTPSGATEAYFDMDVTEASDNLVNGCVDAGQTVVSSTSTVVVCEFYLNTMESVLSQLLIGNSYSTPPRSYVRFNLAKLGGSTRVTANAWIETQMAFGQTRREDMVSANYHNDVMGFFSAVGGRFPPGTEFPNHAYIGMQFEAVKDPAKGLQIIQINEDSPAGAAGLQLGDIVTRLARERTDDFGDVLDGLRKATKEPTYEIEFYRDGAKQTATIARTYRAAVLEPELPPILDEPAEPMMMQTSISPLSIADELAKFAKLRDDGIISEEEFQIQKARLLETQ